MRTNLYSLLSQRLAIYPPLRLHDRFNNITRFAEGDCLDQSRYRAAGHDIPADGDLHRVVFRLDVQPSFSQRFDYSHPGMEPFHTLSNWIQSNGAGQESILRTDLVLLTRILIECSVIVQDVDKL